MTLDEKDDRKDINRRLVDDVQQGIGKIDEVDGVTGNLLEGLGKWLENF